MKSELAERSRNPLPTSDAEVGNRETRIEEVIGSRSTREFALKIGVSEGTLRNLLKGGEPKLDTALRIAEEANVNLLWLATGKGPKYLDEQRSPATVEASAVCIEVDCEEFKEEYALIPGYHICASTGHGALNGGEPVKRHLAFRTKWLSFRGFDIGQLAVVFAKGDSMEPTIHSNNTLLVNIADTKLTDGSIFVLRFGDDLYAKRLQQRFDGSVLLISDNKEYEDQVVRPDEIDSLQIIGKVVWVGKDLY